MKVIEYNRAAVLSYARRWAFSRNPQYYNFDTLGGDCTNFASQCLFAGCGVVNFTPVFGWFYKNLNDRAPAWTSVEYLYDFLTQKFANENGGIGPFATDVPREMAEIGDVVQYANAEGDWYHTVIITGKDGDEILVSAQSNDALDRPISTYNFAAARFLHIEGVRISLNDDICYSILLRGGVDENRT